MTPTTPPAGRDTATGTDPDAKYVEPGYQDKSLGQAVNQDMEKVDDLVVEADGDLEAAEARFEEESAGAPALDRQSDDTGDASSSATSGSNPTGAAKAAQNRSDDPPA